MQKDQYATSHNFKFINRQTSQPYAHYNLCFGINNKSQDKKISKDITSTNKHDSIQYQKNNKQSIEYFSNTQTKAMFHQSQSASFYSNKKKKQVNYLLPEDPKFNSEMQYIRCGFPQRKKKSGEQQLLKLLMKFSNGVEQTFKKQFEYHPSQSALFEQNPESNKGIRPTLKTRTRYNWIKDRYCVNRDKQGSIFPETDRNSNYKQISHDQLSSLRKNILQRKVI